MTPEEHDAVVMSLAELNGMTFTEGKLIGSEENPGCWFSQNG